MGAKLTRPWYVLEAELDDAAVSDFVSTLSPRGATFVSRLRLKEPHRADYYLDEVRKALVDSTLPDARAEHKELGRRLEEFARDEGVACPSFLQNLRRIVEPPNDMSEDADSAIDAVSVMSSLHEIPESDSDDLPEEPVSPQPLPVRPLSATATATAKAPPTTATNGRGGSVAAGITHRYGPWDWSRSATPSRVNLRPRNARAGMSTPGGLRTPPVTPGWPPSSTPAPLDWRSASRSFPKASLGPLGSSSSRMMPPRPGTVWSTSTPTRPSTSSTSVNNLQVTFSVRNDYDYAHLVPKYVERRTHHDRYAWVWDYCRSESYGPGREWRRYLAAQRQTLGETCFEALNGPWIIDHAVMAGLVHDDFIHRPLVGNVLLCHGILNSCGGDDGLWLPSASALLRYCYECGAYPHLVTYHTRHGRPSGSTMNSCNLFFCCRRHCEDALQRLLRAGFTFGFRPSGYLFFARSEKAFVSPFRDEHGGFSGLTIEEGRLCFLLAHTRLMNLRSGIPLSTFKVYDNEWITTTLEQIDAARECPSTKTLASRFADLGEVTDDALSAVLGMVRDYSITVGALERTFDERRRSL
ncbi:hypothetical protein Pmar_PMAR013648 [Perkinsus marinus ATCC 50983]|uniref:Uncharacterized protein n=1 Tax=Perkinsus marinus (strain ATCC 50983 / TXsc) TaxID=423536 RepID=C5LXX2_PERM5|nr:hypothetical protein Pmar_PMAR013648 [Perkinsus marinus ATCC 50983]EEQ98302.1 hypothetical protein Pmar_PMAR013648 [Perkinsus marinus ATCC 50983]|eukprot:XP_002765585.1 hypothetical protein Pmar_PMAR013648 [Perkinsus marinus ATCC 50983]